MIESFLVWCSDLERMIPVILINWSCDRGRGVLSGISKVAQFTARKLCDNMRKYLIDIRKDSICLALDKGSSVVFQS